MTKFNHLRPMLWTQELEETTKFYTEVLGFNLDEKSAVYGWVSLSKDDVGIMAAKPDGHALHSKIFFSGSFYFNVDNVDELWEEVKVQAKICYGPENFEWEMREFAIYDNNGYILQFGENL